MEYIRNRRNTRDGPRRTHLEKKLAQKLVKEKSKMRTQMRARARAIKLSA